MIDLSENKHTRNGKLKYKLNTPNIISTGELRISATMWSAIWQMDSAKAYRHETGADCTLLFIASSTSENNQVAVYMDDAFNIYTCPMDEFEQEFSEVKDEKTD